MPFEHSEERAHQALAVQLIGCVGNAEWSRYAIAHKEIIDRFGRFPHRNAILNRISSADEARAAAATCNVVAVIIRSTARCRRCPLSVRSPRLSSTPLAQSFERVELLPARASFHPRGILMQ